MRKWLTLVVTVAAVVAGLASSGAESAVGQAPKPELIVKPGDLVRFAGSPKVCAVNEVTPRGKLGKWTWLGEMREAKVTTFACWTITSKGTPVPNGYVVFIWQWANQRKALVGYTSWNISGTKILSPKEGQVFYDGGGWPARYVSNPWAVTEDQRLGRKAKLFMIGRWDALRVPTLKGPGFNASIVCDYYKSLDGMSGASCWPVDYLSRKTEGQDYSFEMGEPWRPGDFIIWGFDPVCGCDTKIVGLL